MLLFRRFTPLCEPQKVNGIVFGGNSSLVSFGKVPSVHHSPIGGGTSGKMDGNEDCLTQTVETSVGSLLPSDNIVSVGELPILQEGNSLINADGTLANGNSVLSVPIIRDGSLLNATSQGLVITNTDGTRTLLLDTSQFTVLANGEENATIYDINAPITSTEVIPVIYGEDIQEKSKLPCPQVEPKNSLIDGEAKEVQKVVNHVGTPYDFSDIQPPIKKGPFKCDYCDVVVQKWNQLRKHIKTHADDKPYKCEYCSSSFNVEVNLQLHHATHQTEDPTCPVCMKAFSRLASLKAHLMLHEENDNLTCPDCLEEFTTEVKLNKHLKEHESESSAISCKTCKMEFSSMPLLKEHLKTHYKFRATLNNKSFKRRKLDRSGFNYSCDVCLKTFKKPSQLVRHKRIHTGERPFVCEICNKAFNQKGSLQTHIAMHSGRRPHKCDFCDATFAQKGNLRAHVRRLHAVGHNKTGGSKQNGQNAYRCFFCNCSFRKISNLNTHLTKMHSTVDENGETRPVVSHTIDLQNNGNSEIQGNKNASDVINQYLVLSKNVEDNQEKAHQQVRKLAEEGHVSDDILHQALENSGLPTSDQGKAVACAIDKDDNDPPKKDNPVSDNSRGQRQRKSVGSGKSTSQKWNQCPYCSKEFKKPSDLVRHIRIHTHEKPFKCNECFRAFSLKSTLTAHVKSHIGIKEHFCTHCDKFFSSSGSLKVHTQLHTGVKPYACTICDKRFRTSGHIKSHLLTHSNPTTKPPSKKARLEARAQLLKKDNIHLPDIPLQEPILITDSGLIQRPPKNVSSNYPQSITQSNDSSGDRPYVCEYCERGFKKSSHLKQHIRSHTGEKPYKCNQCSRSFVSNGTLKDHVRTHTGIKSFKCDICSMTFTTNGSLKRHMCTHSEARPFMCPYCQKTFKTNSNCKKHMQTHRLEIAVRAAQNEANKDGNDGFMEGSMITFGELETGGDQQAADPLNNQQFMLHADTLTAESLTQLQQSLEDHIYDEQTEMNNVVPATLPTVGQASLNNMSNTIAETQVKDANAVSNVGAFEQNNVQPVSEVATSTQSYDQNNVSNTITISIPGYNSQFSIQTNTLDMNDLSGLQPASGEDQNVFQANVAINQSENIHDILQHDVVHNIEVQTNDDGQLHKELISEVNENSLNIPVTVAQEDDQSKNKDDGTLKMTPEAEKETYRCSSCSKEFKTPSRLEAHAKTHTRGTKSQKSQSNKENHCNICAASFSSKGSLVRHMKTHQTSIKCYACTALFKDNAEFENHVREKHSGFQKTSSAGESQSLEENTSSNQADQEKVEKTKKTRIRSDIIRLSEEQAQAIANQDPESVKMLSEKILIAAAKDRISEIPVSKGEDPSQQKRAHKCCICPKSFKKNSDLVRHIRIHTGEKPFICAICSRAFTVKTTLDNHILTHNNQKQQYHCHVCNMSYSTKGSLKIHMTLHTGAKPFKCPSCPQRFRTSGRRQRHMRSHTNVDSSKANETMNVMPSQVMETEQTDQSQNLESENGEVILSGNHIAIDQSVIQQMIQANANPNSVIPNITMPADFMTTDTQFLHPSGVEGIQFQLPLIGQSGGVQLDPMSQTLQIDSNTLQQLQEQGNINITINNMMQQLMPSSDSNLLQTSTFVTSNNDAVLTNMENVDGNKVTQLNISVNSDMGNTSNSAFQVSEQTVISEMAGDPSKNANIVVESQSVDDKTSNKTDQNSVSATNAELGHNCDQCNRSFKRAYHLKIHQKTHLEGKSKVKQNAHLCSYCSKSFAKPSQLDRHVRIHTKERPFVCDVCNKSFNQTNSLQIHKKKHTGEKPFECMYCLLRFTQKSYLKVHIQRAHMNDKKEDAGGKEATQIVENILLPNSQQESQMKSVSGGESDMSLNADYLSGVAGELFPQ